VGGHAVAFHGYPRTTGDIDIFVEATEENGGKLAAALADFGFASMGLTARDFLEPDITVQLGYPPHRIDLMTSISGVSFPEAWESRVTATLDGVTIPYIGKAPLLANKAASGRVKDLADRDQLS
jgi:hypothetical protein